MDEDFADLLRKHREDHPKRHSHRSRSKDSKKRKKHKRKKEGSSERRKSKRKSNGSEETRKRHKRRRVDSDEPEEGLISTSSKTDSSERKKRKKREKRKTEREADEEEPVPKSQGRVSSSGEISLSLAETNRLRIEQGLKPLVAPKPPPRISEEEREQARQKAAKEQEAAKLAIQLEKAKKERRRNKKMKGQSLGEMLKDEDEGVLAWVNKSRQIGFSKQKELAEKTAKMLDMQDEELEKTYSQADLGGLTVAHNAADIKEGTTVLVLQDQHILSESGLNEEDDELINVNIIDVEKAREHEENKKKKPLYDVYGDSEFDADGNPKKKSLLPQYDDPEEKSKFRLNEKGKAAMKLKDLQEKLNQHEKMLYNVSDTGKSIASEFYTKAEMQGFKKRKKRRKKKVRRRKKGPSLADELEQTADTAPSSDHGSRASSSRTKVRNQRERERDRRRKAFDKALDKANKVSASHYKDEDDDDMEEVDEKKDRPSKTTRMSLKRKLNRPKLMEMIESTDKKEQMDYESEPSDYEPLDEDEELYASMQKSIRQRQKTKKIQPKGVAETIRAMAIKREKDQEENDADEGLVISSTTEFCSRVPTEAFKKEPKKERAIKHENMDLEDEPSFDAPTTEDVMKMQMSTGFVEVDPKEEKRGKDQKPLLEQLEQASIVPEQPLVSRGMASTLALLAIKGKDDTLDSVGGRARDKVIPDEDDDDPAPNIRLEYLDEWNRKMTPREAFRVQSHKFHGKGPGKKKQEKRMLRYQEELKIKKMSATDTPLMTMQAMEKTQIATKSPYILLSGQSNRFDVSKQVGKM
eukprot:CAMPEP_0174260076 /NCGR_PEP_ID=MMETSP0439-20130205/8812_1 /TAXON_ID=0 /ORGANISM="Stereomyxa ramosa, Strain Chinc5" /LENGTH=807 /DNA_ID=CAMNT_0015344221 /DNA_START=42 /DNA_END=2465 /DNA_ORIENTATION=+